MQNTIYAYEVARIRSIENNILNMKQFEKILNCVDRIEIYKVLQDIGYLNLEKNDLNIENFTEDIYDNKYLQNYQFVQKILEGNDIFKILALKHDYHNIKVLLKLEFSGVITDIPLSPYGNFSVNKISNIFNNKQFEKLNEYKSNAISKIYFEFNKTKNVQIISTILDRVYYEELVSIVKKENNEFLCDLLTIEIDLKNIITFFRVRKNNENLDKFKNNFFDNGKLKYDFFVKNFELEISKFKDDLNYKEYGNFLEDGIEEYIATNNLSFLDKLCDDYIILYLKKGKFISFGIEPIIAYFFAREYELKNLKILLIGKLNNISHEKIITNLRIDYV